MMMTLCKTVFADRPDFRSLMTNSFNSSIKIWCNSRPGFRLRGGRGFVALEDSDLGSRGKRRPLTLTVFVEASLQWKHLYVGRTCACSTAASAFSSFGFQRTQTFGHADALLFVCTTQGSSINSALSRL